MPPAHYLPFDLHAGAFALFLQQFSHAGNVEHASIASGVVSGIILLLLGLSYWKRNDTRLSRKILIGSFSLFILKLSVFADDDYNSTADVVIAAIMLFSAVRPFWKTMDKYQRRALLVNFFGLFVSLPAYIFGVGYLLLYKFTRVGNGVVFFGIMLVGFLVLILGWLLLVGRVRRPGRAARTADGKAGVATKA